jgi:hypothetical protein
MLRRRFGAMENKEMELWIAGVWQTIRVKNWMGRVCEEADRGELRGESSPIRTTESGLKDISVFTSTATL